MTVGHFAAIGLLEFSIQTALNIVANPIRIESVLFWYIDPNIIKLLKDRQCWSVGTIAVNVPCSHVAGFHMSLEVTVT